MPVFIDYTKDIRYKQGIEVGMKEGMEKKAIDIARKMFENGLDISIVQNVTGLDRSRLEEIEASVSKD